MQFSAAPVSRFLSSQSLCAESRVFFMACRRRRSFRAKLFGGAAARPEDLGREHNSRTPPAGLVPKLSLDNNTSSRHASLVANSSNNMWILPLVGYIGLGLGFGFLTLAIGTCFPSPSNFADAYRFHSIRTLLSLRAR